MRPVGLHRGDGGTFLPNVPPWVGHCENIYFIQCTFSGVCTGVAGEGGDAFYGLCAFHDACFVYFMFMLSICMFMLFMIDMLLYASMPREIGRCS